MAQVCIVKANGERVCSPDMPAKSRGKAKGRCTFYHPIHGPREFIRDTGKKLSDQQVVPELWQDAHARGWKDSECEVHMNEPATADAS